MKRERSLNSVFLLVGLFGPALAGCATTGARPDDMSVQAHKESAAAHQLEAEQHEAQYDPQRNSTRLRPGSSSARDGADYNDYNPTAHHHYTAKRHQRHARDHAAAAEALQSFEQAECGSFTPAIRAACPLLGQVAAVRNIPQGVRIRFIDTVNLDAAASHIQCHLAYAASMGREGMNHCPLYLKDVKSQQSGPHTVDLTTTDDEMIRTLRKRAKMHVAD